MSTRTRCGADWAHASDAIASSITPLAIASLSVADRLCMPTLSCRLEVVPHGELDLIVRVDVLPVVPRHRRVEPVNGLWPRARRLADLCEQRNLARGRQCGAGRHLDSPPRGIEQVQQIENLELE